MELTARKWLRRGGIFLAICVGCSIALGIYYRLPDHSRRVPSHAIADGSHTKLGQANAAQLQAHPGQAGVHLLPDGRDAFVARAILARQAEQTIDVQYYMYHQDTVGSLLTQELLAAADRGVRVRILIDDIYGHESEDTWVTLSAHPQIEVRLWNPWRRNRNRMIQSILRFRDINFRMHSKSFTVDSEFTVLGGRNIGDEYFNANPEVAFSDIDVVAVGSPIDEVSRIFDEYWNSEFAYPVESLVRPGSAEALSTLRGSREAILARPATTRYVQALIESDLAAKLAKGAMDFSWSEARVIFDSPTKKNRDENRASDLLISQLAPYITESTRSVYIVSPYFVPGDRAADALIDLATNGVDVRVLTNSLASNDVTAVHAGYAKYRRKLLRGGVRLFEFDESLKDRDGKRFTWLPGLSKSSLHAKTMVMDGEWMFVGSFNFDRRSLNINNEIGLLFRHPGLAGKSAHDFAHRVREVAFEVRFSRPDGTQNMQWVGGAGGPDMVMEQEPHATTFQKALVGILKWLPIDSQL